jgi:hypothetical protein
MDRTQKRNLLAGALACVVLLGLVLTAARSCGGDDYSQHDLGLDAPDARRAVEVVSGLAAAPGEVESHMSETARPNAVAAVQEAAKAMSGLRSVEPVDAAWFGDYMRLTVSCKREAGPPLELSFFLVREDGELRITGMQK